ncbi:lytic transglycosylase domain-containing protein [Massilia aerilata]|uniref:Lytic transglycosylase domain-containing protein n=1 Tax=Massilia aerilata TaxID=453817 RepID=A0ABW0RZY0_9BURK
MLAPCIVIAALSVYETARADCFDDAAQYHQVNPWILRAIAAQETGFKPNTVARNSNNTIDLGMFGVNSVHLAELAQYGVSQADLMDGCKAAFIAGWHLGKQVRKFGNSWVAVGSYHSTTPRYRDEYAARIKRIIDFWVSQGLIPQQAAG